MEALRKLRAAVIAEKPIHLVENGLDVELIRDATDVRIDEELFPLDDVTNFYNEDTAQPLRAVVFCWMHDKSSIVEYKNACLENNVPDFKFLVKAELTTWLKGSSDSSEFIRNDELVQDGGADEDELKKRKADPQMERITSLEIDFVDHNAALHGTKNVMLKSLISDAKRFSQLLKRAKHLSASQNGHSTGMKKQPIIIVSPATTALISLSNIKAFLEEGRFEPPSMKRPENGVAIIHHESDKLVPTAHNIMVVDNVDLFTKPEYWDRVVAIFTTGQAWQFAKYKYTKPEALFQKYPGYILTYTGDVVPKQIAEWNVNVVSVDRGEKRFRDKMIVRDLWMQLEKVLMLRGYAS